MKVARMRWEEITFFPPHYWLVSVPGSGLVLERRRRMCKDLVCAPILVSVEGVTASCALS